MKSVVYSLRWKMDIGRRIVIEDGRKGLIVDDCEVDEKMEGYCWGKKED